MNITWIGSPYFDSKRTQIDRIVIHWFGSKGSSLKSTDSFFQYSGTSSTYAVEEDQIHQYVKEENVPYANGNYPMNQRSITIEFSADVARNATDKTYETGAQLIADISKRRNIPLNRTSIMKHSEVVATQCCGTVDVDRLIKRAIEINSTPMNPLPTELQKYRIDWKEIAVNKGLDVNSAMFVDYRNIDKILSDKVKSATEAKDREIQSLTKAKDIVAQQLAVCEGQVLNNEYAKLGKLTVELVKKAQTL